MPSTACVERERLEALANGVLTGPERDDIELHLSECRSCRDRLVERYREARAARVTTSAPRWLKNRVVRRSAATRFRPAAALATAAVLVISVAAVLILWNRTDTSDAPLDIWRQETSNDLGPQPVAPAANSSLAGAQLNFSWTPVPNATGYEVTLADQRGDVILQEPATQPRLTVSDTTKLQSGIPYFWFVTAKMPDGTRLDSEVIKFTWKGR